MKYSTSAIIIIWFAFTLNSIAQDKIYKDDFPRKFISEKFKEIQNPNVNFIQRVIDIKSIPQKSQNNIWHSELRNPKKEFYEEEEFNAKDTRSTINKTLLDNGFMLIEKYEQNWDTTNSVWVYYSKDSYIYDVNNNETEWLHQNWGGSNWVNYTKYSYAYDGNNNKVEEINQFWLSNISAWKYTGKYSYTYDGNNNQTEWLEQRWDGSNWVNYYKISNTYNVNSILTDLLRQYWRDSVWVNDKNYKITYTYDVNDNPIEEIWLAWDSSAWSNYYKVLYSYDVNNNQTELIRQYWIISAWVNYEKYSHTYDTNNNLTEYFYQYWHDYDSCWHNLDKHIYTYDENNNLIEELLQKAQGFGWEDFLKIFYTYDGNNRLIEFSSQVWYGLNLYWENSGKVLCTYDGNNNLTEWLRQYWDGFDWVITTRLIYSYLPTDVEELTGEFNDYSLSNNYPNPFNPTTTIKYEIAERNLVSIKVFDILGNEIKTLVDKEMSSGKYEVKFNAEELSTGIYFYKLRAGNFQETKKMMLIK